MKTLTNPYAGLEKSERARIQTDISQADRLVLRTLIPVGDCFTPLVGSFLYFLCRQCEAEGITHYTPENYARIVQIVQNRTHIEPAETPAQRHDAGGTAGVRNPNPPIAVHSANTEVPARKRAGRDGNSHGQKAQKSQ